MFPYVIVLVITSIIAFVTALNALRRPDMISKIGALLVFAVLIWALGLSAEMCSSDLSSKFFWNKIQFLGIDLVPIFWLIYTLLFIGYEKVLTRRKISLLGIMFLIKMLFIFTNESHNLFYESVMMDPTDPYMPLRITFGPVFWVFFCHVYALLFFSSASSLWVLTRSPRLYKSQVIILLIITFIPWACSAIFYLKLYLLPFDLTPLVCLLLGIPVNLISPSWLRIEDIKPVARDLVLDSMSDGVIVLDEQNRLLDLNKAAEKIIGFSPKDLIGKPVDKLLDFLPNPPFTSSINNDWNKEVVFGDRVYSMQSSPLYDWRGNIRCQVIVLHDITMQKRFEEELARERDMLYALMDNIPDAIYFKDTSSRFTLVNKAHAHHMGLKDPSEAVGKTDLDFYPEEFAKETLQDEEIIIKTGQPLLGKVEKIVDRNKNIKWVSATKVPVIDKNGNIIGLVGISRDITRLKLMEEELRLYTEHLEELVEERTKRLQESQAWLRNILAASPYAIIVTDISGNIVECNQAALSMFGFSNREAIFRKNALDLVEGKDHKKILKVSEMLYDQGSIRDIELTLRAADGRTFPGEVSLNLIRDSNGNPAFFVAIAKDITERKQMEERLLRSERLAAIGELAGMVGHDLRNPLTSILGAAYYLSRKYGSKLDKKAMEILKIIENDVNYSNKIVNDLLDYSREITLDLKETSLKRLVEASLGCAKVPKNIEVQNLTNEELKIIVDIEKMKRVFINIIKNAIDAMPKGGKLTIKSTESDDNVDILFIDTGVGILPEVLPKLGKPLFTTKARGMGFGLAICKRLVEAHGGSITLESTLGKGTTVRIILPLKHSLG